MLCAWPHPVLQEFLAATLSQHQMEKEENMRAAFQHFDIDNSGTINKDELRQALQVRSTWCQFAAVAADAEDDML